MKKILTLLAAIMLVASPLVAFAQDGAITEPRPQVTTVAGKAEMREQKATPKITEAKERAQKEIDRRVKNLNDLIARLGKMTRLSEANKTSITSTLSAQITALNELGTKIQGEASTTELRADIKTITESYRIYALVMPQVSIIAAADRVVGVADQLEGYLGKLQERITVITNAGGDASKLQTAFDDMKVKIADAKQKAQEAINEIAPLVPDNGDQAVQKTNLAALKSAHAKIREAQQSLVAARKDAGTITKGVKDLSKKTATSTPESAERGATE